MTATRTHKRLRTTVIVRSTIDPYIMRMMKDDGMVDYGRTWVKLSAGYRLESPQVAQDYARALLGHAGPERLLWGSDWPFAGFEDSMRYEDAIASITQWVPDAHRRRIIGGNRRSRFTSPDTRRPHLSRWPDAARA